VSEAELKRAQFLEATPAGEDGGGFAFSEHFVTLAALLVFRSDDQSVICFVLSERGDHRSVAVCRLVD